MIKTDELCDKCKFGECPSEGLCSIAKCEMWKKDVCQCLTIAEGEDCPYYVPLNGMEHLLNQELSVYELKNQKYGDSFNKSVEKYGLISALTRMSDKWNRIENLILTHDNGTDDESLKDSLMDLANYCNMTILFLEK